MARLGPPVDYNPFEKPKTTPKVRLGPPVDFNPFEPKPQMGKYVPGNLPMSRRAQRFSEVSPYLAEMQTPKIIPLGDTEVETTGTLGQIAGFGKSVSNLVDTVPGMYRQSQAMTKLGKALSEYDATGRVQLTPEVSAPQPQAGFGLGPSLSVGDQRLVTPATYAEGQDALDYIESIRRELSSEDANRAEAFRQVEGPVTEAVASTFSQPEQALSTATSLAGAALGTALAGPGAGTALGAKAGAALGMTPALETAYYQTYAEGRENNLSPEASRTRARISTGIEAATEMIPGLEGVGKTAFGTMAKQAVANAVEESVSQTANIASDLLSATLTSDPEARKVYQQLAPKSFGEGVKQVAESALGGLVGGAVMTAPSAALQGASAMRNRLTPSLDKKTTNDKKTSPVTEPLKVTPINGSLTVQSTPVIDTSITAPSDSVVSDTVIPITDKSFSRAAGTNSLQQESQSVKQAPLSISDAGTIIDNRLSSLREAATRDRLDDGTVKSLTKEDEDLRLTLQENEKRVAAGILQTPERPYLSEDQKKVISQYRAEIRERLEKHRAAVGYGNQLSQMETDLSKLGESDQDVVKYAQRLLGDNGSGYTAAKSIVAPTTSQEQSPTVPATTIQTPTANVAPAPVQNVPEASTSVPADTTATPVTGIAQVTPTQTKAPELKKPKAVRNRISTPEQIATQELQQRVKTDPEYRARIEANRALFLSDIQNRAAEIAAQQATQPTQEVTTNGEVLQQEEGQRQQQGQGPEVTPAQLATGTTSKPTYASEQELKDDLFSGWMDPLASNAQKMDTQGRLVVYNGLSDLDTKDPQAATGVRKALSVVSGGRQGASASAFAYNGKVYLDVAGVEKGQAKSKFLHEAMVHVEAKAGTDGRTRVNSLAARVDAWANAGDPTARAAIDHVNTHYAGLINKANAGDTTSAFTVQEEKLAKYAQMLYDKYGGDAKGMVGTAKRLYNDIISYFREKISRGLKALGFDGLQIRDRDILDAVRYGRDVTAFKDSTYTPGQATAATPSASSVNMASPDMDAQLAINTNQQPDAGPATDTRNASLYKKVGDAGIRAVVAQGTASSDTFRVAVEERAGFERLYRFKAEILTKEMDGLIENLSKSMPDRAATRDMYRKMAADYFDGDTSVPLPQAIKDKTDELRNIVTDLQVLGIAYGVWGPKSVPRIMKSFGKWSRRAYQVFDLNPGEWAAIQRSAAARGESDIVGQELPNIIDSMRLPSADEIKAMGVAARRKIPTDITKKEADKRKKERDAVRAKMRRYAESWGITSKKFKDIEAQLIALEAMGEDTLKEKAREWGNRLLDPHSTSTFSKMIGPNNNLLIDDSSVDKARKEVPEWLQRLWGRHERIDSQALISIEHLAAVVAKFRAMTDLLSSGLANGTILPPTAVGVSKRGYKKLTSDNPKDYGPLEGHWIKEEDAWLLEQGRYETALESVLRQGTLEQYADMVRDKSPNSFSAKAALATATVLGPIGRAFKTLQVNASISALFINTASAFALLAPTMTSWSAIKSVPKSISLSRSSSFAGIPLLQAKITDAALSKDLDYMMSKGLLQDGALAASSRKQAIERIQEESNALRSGFSKLKNGAVNAVTSTFDVLSRFNGAGDEVAKIITFYARTKWNMDVFGVSEKEAKDMAIEEVKNTMPSYTRTSPVAKALSNLAVIGAFTGWHAEMIRTSVNLSVLGGNKIVRGIREGNVGLVKYGMFDLSQVGLRTTAITMMDVAIGGGALALASMVGASDDEEEQIKKAQEIESDPTKSNAMYELMPGWNKSNVHVLRDLGNGKYVTATTRRYEMMPWGQMISAISRDDPEAAMNTLKDTFTSIYPTAIAAPGLGVSLLEWYNADGVKDSAAAWDKVEKYSRDLAKSLTAGSIRTGAKILSGDEKNDVKFTKGELALEVAGFSPTVVDLGNIISQHVFQYTGAIDDEKRRLSKDTYSEDGAIDLFNNVSLKYDLWKDARRKVEALKAMGYDYNFFSDALDRNPATANVSEDEREGLWEGFFMLPDYTEFLNDREDKELERSPDKADEIKAKYQGYRDRLSEDWPKIEKMLNEQNVTYYED